MQALAATLDLVGATLLAILLARLGIDPRRSVAVAWSPIGALHFAHSAHNDSAMIAALLAGVLLLTSRRRVGAMAALAAAVMIKLVPLLGVPSFARAAGTRALAVAAALCVLVTLPFLSAGSALVVGALSESGQEFNSSVHLLIARAVGLIAPRVAEMIASGVCGVIIVVATLLLAWRSDGSPRAVMVATLRALGAYVLLAPIVEPWYLTWLAPLTAVALVRGRLLPFLLSDSLAWLWLGGIATLTDLTYLPGGTGLWPAIRLAEYGPVYLLLLALALHKVRQNEAAHDLYPQAEGTTGANHLRA
jgi:hypothetical protein